MVLGLSTSADLKIKVLSEKDCVATISVEWPADKVKEKIEQAFRSVQSQARLPGFRPGKSPMELVKKNFQDTAYSRAQEDLLHEGVSEALKAKKLSPIETPVIQSVQFDPEKAFQFEFRVEVAPKLKLVSYKGLKLTKSDKAVTDDDIKKSLTQVADMNARLVESSATEIGPTHFAVIDYEGFLDGQPIEGAKAQNFLIDMAAPQAIAGLADGLTGVKTGEEKEIPVTFPEDSPAKDLAGKQAVFKVKLHAIKEKATPNLDDELAKDMGLTSLAELETKIRENLVKEASLSARHDLEKQVVERLLSDNVFSIPPSLIERQSKSLVERQKARLLRQSVSPEDQIKLIESKMPEIKAQAEKDIRLAYILDEIGETEKITVTEEELGARVREIISRADPREKESLEKALQGEFRSRINSEVREIKVFDLLIQQAKLK